jgi:hypothetical protein
MFPERERIDKKVNIIFENKVNFWNTQKPLGQRQKRDKKIYQHELLMSLVRGPVKVKKVNIRTHFLSTFIRFVIFLKN